MKAEEFFNNVKLMREAQKRYFRTRSVAALNESKSIERVVDYTIEIEELQRKEGKGLWS